METLSQILDKLSDFSMESDDALKADILKSLWEYYQKQGRHTYHEITEYILKNMNEEKDGEAIPVITENLKSLLVEMEAKFKCSDGITYYDCKKLSPPSFDCEEKHSVDKRYQCHEYKRLYKSLFKLYDHIRLEFIRWSEVKKETDIIDSVNKSLQNQVKENNEQQKKIEEKYENITSGVEDVKNQTKSIYMQMVSILGIFAAIVIAVFGGLSVLNSISSAFLQGEITIYKTILVASMCALFVIWVIFTLLGMVRWFRFEALPTKFSVWSFAGINVVCLAGIIFALVRSGAVT